MSRVREARLFTIGHLPASTGLTGFSCLPQMPCPSSAAAGMGSGRDHDDRECEWLGICRPPTLALGRFFLMHRHSSCSCSACHRSSVIPAGIRDHDSTFIRSDVAARARLTLPLVGGVPSADDFAGVLGVGRKEWFEKQDHTVEEQLKPDAWLLSNLDSHGAGRLKIVEGSDMFQGINVPLGALN